MPPIPVHRLPLVPAPDLGRLFGRRDGPPRIDPDAVRLRAAADALDLHLAEPRLLRLALTDPGWCNEAETPPWVEPWPGNRALAELGSPHLGRHDPAALGEVLGLWSHLWLATGQRTLHGHGRATVLARAAAAVVGAVVQDAGVAAADRRIAAWAERAAGPTAPVG